jgi:hypothetical protein
VLRQAKLVAGSETINPRPDGTSVGGISLALALYGPNSLGQSLHRELTVGCRGMTPAVPPLTTPVVTPNTATATPTTPRYASMVLVVSSNNYQPCVAPRVWVGEMLVWNGWSSTSKSTVYFEAGMAHTPGETAQPGVLQLQASPKNPGQCDLTIDGGQEQLLADANLTGLSQSTLLLRLVEPAKK